MYRKLVLASLVLCLMVLGGTSLAFAGQADRESLSEDPIERMLSEGWIQVAEGVFQRSRGNSAVESIAFGPEGFAWRIQEMRKYIVSMEAEHESYPSRKLARIIARQKREIARLELALRNGEVASADEKVLINGCNVNYGAHADAYYRTDVQGVGAISDASFSVDCGKPGHTEAHVYVRANLNGVDTTHTVLDPRDGVAVQSNASWSLQGGPYCYSSASASVDSTLVGVTYAVFDENYECPLPSLQVGITGTSSTLIGGFTCKTLTWTSSVSGGASPYSYLWKRDGVVVGSGSSYSKTFCGNDTSYVESVNLTLTVTDSASATRTEPYVTTINYFKKPVIENPCYPYRCIEY